MAMISASVTSWAVMVSLMDFWLILFPFGHDDEPEILHYAITAICSIGIDVGLSQRPSSTCLSSSISPTKSSPGLAFAP